MIKLEKILGIIFLVGLIFKLTFITGASLLLTVSLLALACLYYPLGFAFFNQIGFRKILKKDSYKGLSKLRIIGAIVAGMSLSPICVGILYKIQNWTGANINLEIGLISTLIVLAIALFKYFKSKGEFYIRIFKRIAIIGSFGLIFLCLSNLTIAKIRFRNHPDYIKAYEMYLDNPQDEELRQKLHVEYLKATMSEEEVKMYLKQEEKK